MILTLVLSSILLAALTVFDAFFCGASVTAILDIPSILSILVVFTILVILTGYGKDFSRIFWSKSHFNSLDLQKLRKTKESLEFCGKLLLYSSLIFPLLCLIYVLANFEPNDSYRMHLGPNFAVLIISFIYMSFLELLLYTVKMKTEKAVILYMADSEDNDNTVISQSKTFLSVVKVILGLFLIVAVIFVLAIITDGGFNWGRNPLLVSLMDMPSLIAIVVPVVLLLAISQNWKEFFGGIRTVFSNKILNVTQKSLYLSAVKNVRFLNLYSSVLVFCTGLAGILCNLENINSLCPNLAVCCIPLFYMIVINLVLFLVEIRINKVAE